jgi:BolA protein
MIDNSERMLRMRAALSSLAPSELEVVDDSHKHVGREGARDGRGHFSVDITSAIFEGLAPLARHRRVYAALGEMMQTDIHALSIVARTPAEAASRREAGA